ncbi:uncharacterized protein LOC131802708 [Musca domestica]|uniref:Uncharacterized protein LOC131802708 n=1 Tax=Musca domestica TaxID=7370 RepID=A0ABM3UZZ6_MUSDO|nr:uncharacterized protein LOC131802708 [Musca domestica]
MASKKLRFRGDATTNRIDDIGGDVDDDERKLLKDVDAAVAAEVVDGIHKRSSGSTSKENSDIKSTKEKKAVAEEEEEEYPSFMDFFKLEYIFCWLPFCWLPSCVLYGVFLLLASG